MNKKTQYQNESNNRYININDKDLKRESEEI